MRTSLVDENGNPRYTNRLAKAASPYLVQHAHNPVDWYPWGSEAFERAKAEDKPVFLSVGYSTCHWCHVMEAESFDNEAIATYLNQHFISIKLDREERPDLDEVYMTGVQMLTGQGGWPMSNFLTPEGAPFFAGTYFPPEDFRSLLEQVVQVWKDRREEVEMQANEIAANIARFTSARAESKSLGDRLVATTAAEVLGRLDETNGGFGGAPKFPNESMLSVILDDLERSGSADSRHALDLTLDRMFQGGIFDQIAGGFHRYTVDAIWLVPHFEKMLYNQAQLLRIFARAARLRGDAEWRRAASMTAAYVLRDMANSDGLFYSATDADSEGEEGRFFIWTPGTIDAALSEEDAALARRVYCVTEAGNFEGASILHTGRRLADLAAAEGQDLEEFLKRLDSVNGELYRARELREHPARDEKIITAWNGMMITALASAGQDLEERDWIEAAQRCADALWSHSATDTGLWRINMNGQLSTPGNLEDFAFFAESLMVLYAVTGAPRYLVRGERLVEQMIEQFWDEEHGGFFLANATDDGPMITRPKSPMDGATASANSAALHALVWLWRATGKVWIEERITGFISAFAGLIASSPPAFSYMALAIENFSAGQTGSVQFAGGGNIRAVLSGQRLTLHIADGWHINADSVDDDSLIPTRVVAEGARVDYPAAEESEWFGEVGIDITGDADTVAVTLQPCSGELCLAPETLHIRLRV